MEDIYVFSSDENFRNKRYPVVSEMLCRLFAGITLLKYNGKIR